MAHAQAAPGQPIDEQPGTGQVTGIITMTHVTFGGHRERTVRGRQRSAPTGPGARRRRHATRRGGLAPAL